MKAVVAAFNQEKALVGALSVITNLWMDLFEALVSTAPVTAQKLSSQVQITNCFCLPPIAHWSALQLGQSLALTPRYNTATVIIMLPCFQRITSQNSVKYQKV